MKSEDNILKIIELIKSKKMAKSSDIQTALNTSQTYINRYLLAIRNSGSKIIKYKRYDYGAYIYWIEEDTKITRRSIMLIADEFRDICKRQTQKTTQKTRKKKAKKAVKIPLKQRIKRILIKFILGL